MTETQGSVKQRLLKQGFETVHGNLCNHLFKHITGDVLISCLREQVNM